MGLTDTTITIEHAGIAATIRTRLTLDDLYDFVQQARHMESFSTEKREVMLASQDLLSAIERLQVATRMPRV